MSRNVALDYKPITLIDPTKSAGSTINGSAAAITPSEEADAVAVVSVGPTTGTTPTSMSVIVTLDQQRQVEVMTLWQRFLTLRHLRTLLRRLQAFQSK